MDNDNPPTPSRGTSVPTCIFIWKMFYKKSGYLLTGVNHLKKLL